MAQVLLIDDDAPFRRMLRHALEQAGHVVVEAGHGKEGLQRYRQAPIDLVITDLLMPEQEGLATIRALRRESAAVKVIAISGGGRSGQLDLLPVARHLGAQYTFWKPFPHQAFLDAVHALTEH